jgi:C-terminal processing protease CtpA/Prc
MPQEATLPLRVEVIEHQIVIVAVGAGITELRAGDIVERIDGLAAPDAFERLAGTVSAATPQRRKQVTFRFGAGPPGSQAKLEVRGADDTVHAVTIARSGSLSPLDLKRPPKLHEIRPGVFYVDVTRLSDQEFNEALPRLAQAKGLVFDVRGYPTGSPQWLTHLSRERLQSARWNVPRQHRPDWTNVEWVTSRWDLAPQDPLLTTNRVFLTDGSAISYAETVLGIIEAYRLGEIVGEATAGTNGNICIVDLPLGYRMVFTGMKVLKHDGSRHHGVGIRPTVPVARTIQGIHEGRDEQLERAVSLVQ